MKNVKFILGFAVFGFLISLIAGFNAQGNYFGRIIIHALIFAIVFGGLGAGIQFLFAKFLQTDSSYSMESSVVAPAAASAHAVDITVQDEELPAEENTSQFYVGSSRQMLAPEDMNGSAPQAAKPASSAREASSEDGEVGSMAQFAAPETPLSAVADSGASVAPSSVSDNAAPRSAAPASPVAGNSTAAEIARENAAGASASDSGFVPIALGEKLSTVSSVEARSQAEIDAQEKKAAQAANSAEGELDTLPDLEDISSFSAPSAAPMEEVDSMEDSGYEAEGPASTITAEEVTDGKDAELMAKAISTLLAKE